MATIRKPGNLGKTILNAERRNVRRNRDKELLHTEILYQTIVDQHTDLICRFRPDGILTFVNQAFCRYFEKHRDQLIGRSLLIFVHPQDRALVKNHLASLNKKNKVATVEHRVQLPNGEIRWQQRTDRAIYDQSDRPVEFQSMSRDITKLIQTQNALQKRRDHYQSLISKMGNAFILMRYLFDSDQNIQDCRLVEANPAFEKITGLQADQMIGKSVRAVFPGTEDFWFDQSGMVATTGKPIQFNQCSKLFDSYFEVVAYSPQKDYVAAVFTDITLRMKIETALRESEMNFRAIAENANDAIVIILDDGRQVYVNRHASELSGYSKADLLKMRFYDLIRSEEVEQIQARNTLRLEDKPVSPSYETVMIKKDEEQMPVEITASKTIWKGQASVLQIIRDISLHKRLEETFEKINTELEQRVKQRTRTLEGAAEKLEKKQQELLRHKMELETANRELVQTNAALTVLARNIDKKRDETEKRIAQTISSQIMSLIEELKTHKIPEKSRAIVELLLVHLNELTRAGSRSHEVIVALSAMELRVATMIKNGFTSEEIARVLNISPHTVKTHRRNIRKKLNLKNENINLPSYLKAKLGRDQSAIRTAAK
jgi:PAS domain S-box-containing protein